MDACASRTEKNSTSIPHRKKKGEKRKRMKASYHNSRDFGSPRHNDRSFLKGLTLEEKYKLAPHIIHERTGLNKYVSVYPGKDFRETEVEFYAKIFKPYVDDVNKKRDRSHHKEVKEGARLTTEMLRLDKLTKPEETIIQIGDMEDYPDDPKILLRVFEELQKYSNKITHNHCKILDAAVHMDESTPHIHIRKVWVYEKDGIKRIGQEESLRWAGIPLPYPDRRQSKFNNRKITYDRMMREKLIELCKEHGLEIDTVPDLHNREHLSKEELARKVQADRERAERRRRRRQELRESKRS